MKMIKMFLLGLVCLLTIGWVCVDSTGKAVEAGKFDQPRRLGSDKKLVVYKEETYKSTMHRIGLVPFVTKGYSLVRLDQYYLTVGDEAKKGIMIVSIYKGPDFGYAIYDLVEEEGFGLVDADCDGEVDTKVPYHTTVLIPDCLYEHRTNETG